MGSVDAVLFAHDANRSLTRQTMRAQRSLSCPAPVIFLVAMGLQFFLADEAAQASECNTILIGDKRVPYLANRSFMETNPAISRAIIVIHGGYRIPEEYYAPILVALASRLELEKTWRRRTIVLAPHFQEKSEAAPGEHWWNGDWREGGESDGVSSYTVVDTLVDRLRGGAFP